LTTPGQKGSGLISSTNCALPPSFEFRAEAAASPAAPAPPDAPAPAENENAAPPSPSPARTPSAQNFVRCTAEAHRQTENKRPEAAAPSARRATAPGGKNPGHRNSGRLDASPTAKPAPLFRWGIRSRRCCWARWKSAREDRPAGTAATLHSPPPAETATARGRGSPARARPARHATLHAGALLPRDFRSAGT